MTDLVLTLDPATGDLALDDGSPAPSQGIAVDFVVWTLRTPLGRCVVAPDHGVDWNVAQVDVAGAPVKLKNELERALRWIVEGGWMLDLVVTVTRAARRLAYTIAFNPAEGGERRTIRGTT